MSGFCPVEWVPCHEGCPPEVCRLAPVEPSPARDVVEEYLTALERHGNPTLDRAVAEVRADRVRRASDVDEVTGGTLPG